MAPSTPAFWILNINSPTLLYLSRDVSFPCLLAQALRQFLVWDCEGVAEKEDTIVEDLFQACDEDTDDERPAKGSKNKEKKKKADTESEEDEESSATSSDDKKACWERVLA